MCFEKNICCDKVLLQLPSWHTVRTVSWERRSYSGWKSVPLSNFEYVGDYNHNCSLRIRNIQQEDAHYPYHFKFTTNHDSWTSRPIYLSVTEDLIASVVPTIVKEGERVILACHHSGCRTYAHVWFKEGQKVSQTYFMATREDAGMYSCALQGQDHVQSKAVFLNVYYAPKNVKLLISPPENIIQGKSVHFSCTSEANPPVKSSEYHLFKDGNVISVGPNHSISNVQPSDSGQYYCQAQSNIIWNGLFQSTKTNVNVLYPPMNISISAELTEVTEGSDVNMTCHSNANPSDIGYTWYKTSSSSRVQVGSGQVLSLSSVKASSSGHYICKASNRVGENNSTELLLSVKIDNAPASFPILAGTGLTLLIGITVVLLLLYWW
ncbi:hypothetical protein WMY93_026742 [Mugilogobius chulae]|uniref:Ig-like domain-containing protein n=1 Tax=Mugilogobius chulae TaxID=88201 RepID=A0AAW0N389_9GOBI